MLWNLHRQNWLYTCSYLTVFPNSKSLLAILKSRKYVICKVLLVNSSVSFRIGQIQMHLSLTCGFILNTKVRKCRSLPYPAKVCSVIVYTCRGRPLEIFWRLPLQGDFNINLQGCLFPSSLREDCCGYSLRTRIMWMLCRCWTACCSSGPTRECLMKSIHPSPPGDYHQIHSFQWAFVRHHPLDVKIYLNPYLLTLEVISRTCSFTQSGGSNLKVCPNGKALSKHP